MILNSDVARAMMAVPQDEKAQLEAYLITHAAPLYGRQISLAYS